MKLELIEKAPIDEALKEITANESAQADITARTALAGARVILEKALQLAANPDLAGGIDAEQYARQEGITLSAAYKRIHKAAKVGNPIAVKQPGLGWRIQQAS
jgi:hypothetical protein